MQLSGWRRAAIAIAFSLALAGCVDSSAPILSGAQPVWGAGARFQLYTLAEGGAKEPDVIAFRWDGNSYSPLGAKRKEFGALTVHPFEGRNVIIQSRSRQGNAYEYALARRVADGVYLVTPIDEQDADDAMRSRFCRGGQYTCRIVTEEALFALARATAAKNNERGGLAILLADAPPPAKKRR